MLLAIDMGNSLIKAAIFLSETKIVSFRKVKTSSSYDDLLQFFSSISNSFDITDICISSVSQKDDLKLKECLMQVFSCNPIFLSYEGNLNFKMDIGKNVQEVGADLIATSIASSHLFPNCNVLTISSGTANAFSLISHDGCFKGAIIAPGLNMLEVSFYKTFPEIMNKVKPVKSDFKMSDLMPISTEDAVHAGLISCMCGTTEYIIQNLKNKVLGKLITVATGGVSRFLMGEGFQEKLQIDYFDLDFTVKGIYYYYKMNRQQ